MAIDALFCIGKDPWSEPRGGQANFGRQIIKAFGGRLAVACVSDKDVPLRTWIDRPFEGTKIKYFNMGNILNHGGKRPLMPLRLKVLGLAILSMPKIYSIGIKNLLLESPELLFAASSYKWDSVCYRFAGVNNPVLNSRYMWARKFGKLFETMMFSRLHKINVDTMLASADYPSIDDLVERSNGMLNRNLIHHFPTRVDMDKFKPFSDKHKSQEHSTKKIKTIVTCGRISWVKGWDLILEAIHVIKKKRTDLRVIFIGDGEDKKKLFKKASELGIIDDIKVTGFIPHVEVNRYLNLSDLCVVASYREGWSLAMLEMLACGKAIVSTEVSGAKEMIQEGRNGFILANRSPEKFAMAIDKALKLKNAKETSLKIAERYSSNYISKDLGQLWRPLS